MLHGETLAEAAEHAHALARASGLVLVHPYDDPAVMAGQGTLALEMLADAPDLDVLVIPVGGGGMIAGCAVGGGGAASPASRCIGVEVEAYASLRSASPARRCNRRRDDRRGHRGARHRRAAAAR